MMSFIFKDSVTKMHHVFVIIKLYVDYLEASTPITNEKGVRHETQI